MFAAFSGRGRDLPVEHEHLDPVVVERQADRDAQRLP